MTGGGWLGWVLGANPSRGTPTFAGHRGDAVTGFRVVDAQPGRRLEPRGRHPFASYALTFDFEGGHLSATTHAQFPGLRGRLYRTLVIGTGAHRLVTRYLLRRIAPANCPV